MKIRGIKSAKPSVGGGCSACARNGGVHQGNIDLSNSEE